MDDADYTFFKNHGYLVLGKVLSDEAVVRFVGMYDRDRREHSYFWRLIGPNGYQTVNCDPLVSCPDVDAIIRHPHILPPIEALMGSPVCLSEACLRHMAPHEGKPVQHWHRDRPHEMTHPLRTGYIHLMLYLSDVHEGTHCFSISPESIHDPILEHGEQLARAGSVDLHGPAGTAILFNLSVLHTATVRKTPHERKTVQIYYGHRFGPVLSHYSTIPSRLWRDHPDPEARAFYGNLNHKSRIYAAAFGAETVPEETTP